MSTATGSKAPFTDPADVLESAHILGISPDEAATMSASEVGFALGVLKAHSDDRNVTADLLVDAAQVA